MADRIGPPGPASLPEVINPFAFLCQNVLRWAWVAVVETAGQGPEALGLIILSQARRSQALSSRLIVIEV